MSFQDAAAKILQDEGKPLSAEEITQKALQKGLINTKGKTPSATMGSRIYVSVKTLGEKAPFIKVAKNRFALRVWQETSTKAVQLKQAMESTLNPTIVRFKHPPYGSNHPLKTSFNPIIVRFKRQPLP